MAFSLSDLGQRQNPNEGVYDDDCYVEDRDDYIEIILVGDEEAVRNVTLVEIPALEGGYRAVYNLQWFGSQAIGSRPLHSARSTRS